MPLKAFEKTLKEDAMSAAYGFFEPARAVGRFFFRPRRRYRVTYRMGNGMSSISCYDSFLAWNDHEARKQARKIVGHDRFELETFRVIKVQ